MSLKRALVKTAGSLAALATLGTLIIGVAHTPWGKPLLGLPLLRGLASHAGCPVGSIEPAAFERVRAQKLHGEQGQSPAASHPALGFTLGVTSRGDVERWIGQRRLECESGAVASVVECKQVALPGAPLISKLTLQFDGQSKLVSLDLFRSGEDAEALLSRFRTLSQELSEQVGPATTRVGEPSLGFMRSAPLQTVMQRHSYRGYVATVMLLNLGKRGLRLREQYQWAGNGGPA